MDFLSAWHAWVILGLIAGALEIKLSGFVMLWFAIGSFAAALGAGLGLGLAGQLAIFSVVSVALFAASRTIFQKAFMRGTPELKTGAAAMVGQEATVVDALPAKGSGTVRINGELWHARSLEGDIAAGETVTVDSIEGLKLKVRKSQSTALWVQQEKTR